MEGILSAVIDVISSSGYDYKKVTRGSRWNFLSNMDSTYIASKRAASYNVKEKKLSRNIQKKIYKK